MVTIITTRADKWYLAQIPQVRALRDKSADVQAAGCQALIDRGLIPPDQISQYLEVFKYGWDPAFVFADAIDALARAPDLVISLPFTPVFPNRRGDPSTHIGDCWYESRGQAPDSSPVGSIDPTGTYEKFVCNAGTTIDPTYYSDWSLQWGDRELRVWLKVK